MRILSRYVLREFLTPVLYCFIAFASLYLVIDVFGQFDNIIPAKPSFDIIIAYVGGSLAKVFGVIMPASLFLGGLYAMWQLSRHSEIIAMRANGISFITITSPIIIASFVFAALVFLNSEFYAPGATTMTKRIKDNRFQMTEESRQFEKVLYHNLEKGREWQIGTLDLHGILNKITISWVVNGTNTQELTAEHAIVNNGIWYFSDAVLSKLNLMNDGTGYHKDEKRFDIIPMPELDETIREFVFSAQQSNLLEDSDNLSIIDMKTYLSTQPNMLPEQYRKWSYNIFNRFSAPFSCVVITLFAIPFGVATGRQSVFIGILSAIILFLIYYVMNITCGAFAQSGQLPIAVGATLPSIVFLFTGIFLFYRQR